MSMTKGDNEDDKEDGNGNGKIEYTWDECITMEMKVTDRLFSDNLWTLDPPPADWNSYRREQTER